MVKILDVFWQKHWKPIILGKQEEAKAMAKINIKVVAKEIKVKGKARRSGTRRRQALTASRSPTPSTTRRNANSRRAPKPSCARPTRP